jgi:iron complex outermembrane recepter protein
LVRNKFETIRNRGEWIMSRFMTAQGGAGSSREVIFGASLLALMSSMLATAMSTKAEAQSTSATAAGVEAPASGAALQEVVVTAQKRTERLQDVPVPVTAITADSLVSSGQVRIEDYYTRVPGLSVTPNDYGAPQVAIRGLTTGGFTNPTVGVVVDDVPYGASSGLAYGQEVPDFDPSDLARVEVLRGPQGTLYGASSLGGLLKFVTVDPSTEGLSGRVQAGLSSIYNGADLGYNVHAAVNMPIDQTLAVRASAFTRQDAGYIDNILTDQHRVNKGFADGGRLSALWRPSEDLSLKASALFQHFTTNGSSEVDVGPGLGDLQQNSVRGAGASCHDFQAYSATFTARLGDVDLTTVTGYNVNKLSESFDFTETFAPLTEAVFGVTGSPLTADMTTSKFTQEIRLSGRIGPTIEWLFGAFYDHEDSLENQHLLAVVPVTGATIGTWLDNVDPSTFAEYAAFADMTIHITDRFDVQLGGRESHNRQTYMETFTGPYDTFILGKPSPVIDTLVATEDNSFTYLVTPRLKLSPNFMVYARLASGYRPGGPNLNSTSLGLPSHYNPDTTENYEIGVKGDILDHAFSFDASLYYIQWKDVQLQLVDPRSEEAYYANGSRAKSEGVELAIESRPLTGMTIAGWITIDDASLTQAFPKDSSAYGASGAMLPYSSHFSGSLSVDQEVPLRSTATGFVGVSVSYVGDREGQFTPSAARQTYPGYAKTDLRAGVKYESWTVDFFANNATDRRGLLNGGLGTFVPIAFDYIQPRTIGLSVAKTF